MGSTKKTNYYHITESKNVKKILKDGLKCDEEGNIFLFEHSSYKTIVPIMNNETNKKISELLEAGAESFPIPFEEKVVSVADTIAINQLFITRGAILEINSNGITADLIPDNVAESSARFQWIAKQKTINPKYIKLYEMRNFKERYFKRNH